MGIFNQSLISLKLLVSFLVFLLGTKFTPHIKYSSKTQKKLHEEAYDTLRKVFWVDYFRSQPTSTKGNGVPLKYFVKKSTDVASSARTKLLKAAKGIADISFEQIKESWPRTAKFYLDNRFWSEISPRISHLRFVMCDKNLGGELLDKSEYFALNRKEMANYELVCAFSTDKRSIETILRKLMDELLLLLRVFENYLRIHSFNIQPLTDIRAILVHCTKLDLNKCNLLICGCGASIVP